MFCKYCKVWNESEEKIRGGGNYCVAHHTLKEGKEESCDDFVLNHFFQCIRMQRRQEMEVCLHVHKEISRGSEKHQILYPNCINCSQKEEIIELHRGIRSEKPLVLIKREQKEAPEPQILRKKAISMPELKSKLVLKKKDKPILIKRKE